MNSLKEFVSSLLNLTSQYYIFDSIEAKSIFKEIVELWELEKEEILAHTLETDEIALEYKKYKTAELLSELIYPSYKFSEFGRLYLNENDYNEYYQKVMDTRNWHSYDRKYNLKELLKQVNNLPGDIVECGVYKGASAILMCEAAKLKQNTTVYLFDSFEGLSKPESVDGRYWEEGRFEIDLKELSNNLRGYNNYKIYQGWIPNKFYHVNSKNFKFIHIDVDLYSPTLNSLEFFYPRLNHGGLILLDDYGFYSCPGAKRAVDQFCSENGIEVSTISSGQGLIIKK